MRTITEESSSTDPMATDSTKYTQAFQYHRMSCPQAIDFVQRQTQPYLTTIQVLEPFILLVDNQLQLQ